MSWQRNCAHAVVVVVVTAIAARGGAVGANDHVHLDSISRNGASTALHAAPERPSDFARGARYWSLTEGFARSQTKGDVYLTQLHVSHYHRDNVAILFGGTIGYSDAKRADDGVFGGPEVGMRWHFAQNESWSTFLDGSAGFVFHEEAVTPDSLRFNFDLQLGVGATYRVSSHTLVIGGVRSFHLSNARIEGKDNNLGYDAPLVYIGLLWYF